MATHPHPSAGLVLSKYSSFSPWVYQLDDCLMLATSIIASWEDPFFISHRATSRPDECIDREIDCYTRLFSLSLVPPHSYYQNFLAQGVGMGIGMGLMFLPALTITSHYFQKRRSIAMGCVIAGRFIPLFLCN